IIPPYDRIYIGKVYHGWRITMLSCWIIYNGSLTSDKFKDQAELLQGAAEQAGVQVELKRNYDVLIDLANTVEYSPSFVVFLDKDIIRAQSLKNDGNAVFHCPDFIETCHNKAKRYLQLAVSRIPTPETMIALNVYPAFTNRDSG